MTMEEEDQMQGEIPEWKRQAMVTTEEQTEEEKKGLLKKLRHGVSDKINQTSAAKSFYQSDEYKKIEKMRAEMSEFKHNLKDEIDSTQNPFVQRTREALDLALMESSCARAVKEMQLYDKDFDLLELTYEV